MSIESTQSCPHPSSATNSGRGCWDYLGGTSRNEVEFIVNLLTGSVRLRCSAAFNAHERHEKGAVVACLSLLLNSFEDKGLSIGLALLLALAVREASDRMDAYGDSESRS